MAEPSVELSYAGMIRRRAAEDVARWQARMVWPIWEPRRSVGDRGTGFRLTGMVDDEQSAPNAGRQKSTAVPPERFERSA